MFDLNSISKLREKLFSVLFSHPDLEIQLFLVLVAIVFALLLSQLIRRMVNRKLQPSHKYGWVASEVLPALLSPFLTIMILVAVGWISLLIVPIHQRIIAGLVKLMLVWLISRVLLLLTHKHFMAYFISFVMFALTLLSVTHLLIPVQESLGDITFDASHFHVSLLGIIKGIFTLIVMFWGANALSKTGESWLRHAHLRFNARELGIKFLRITLYFAAFMFTLNEMGVDLTALTFFGSALAVGLGVGLQKITSNFISGIILLFESTIEAGDLIEVGGEKGWVRQMAIRHTLIETPDGREMLIPNEDLITGKVTNWTYTNTRARIDITLTIEYNSDVDKALQLLLNAAKAHPECITDPEPACYIREFAPTGIQVMLVFWIPDVKAGMSSAKSTVMRSILKSFKESGIIFATANSTANQK